MTTPTPERNEEVRYAVRQYLAERPSIAQMVSTIRQRLAMENDFTYAEVQAALDFLVSLEQVKLTVSKLGSSKYYQITAAGTLAHERNE
jgi:hypothetical protein